MSAEALQIQTVALDLVKAGLNSFFKKFLKSPALVINAGDLPAFGVFITREDRLADGDANAGPPHFINRLTLHFTGSIAIETSERGDPMVELEAKMTEIDDLLLKNPKFVNLSEGIASMSSVPMYSKVGDTQLGEIRVEMVLLFRTRFEPNVTDDFLTMHITTAYPSPDSEAESLQVEQIVDIPQN